MNQLIARLLYTIQSLPLNYGGNFRLTAALYYGDNQR